VSRPALYNSVFLLYNSVFLLYNSVFLLYNSVFLLYNSVFLLYKVALSGAAGGVGRRQPRTHVHRRLSNIFPSPARAA